MNTSLGWEMYILLFFTYSILGWLMESTIGSIRFKKPMNRGFLIGPYCPVYGVGCVLITLLFSKYSNDILVLFILSTVTCGALEYLTSYVMEKLFNARWWDYSYRKFNINGRVCLNTLLPFGIGGTLVICFINPFFINLYNKIPENIRIWITSVLCVLFAIDFIVSFKIILSFKGATYKEKDSTEEISAKVKDRAEEIIMKAESDVIELTRDIKYVRLSLKRKLRYKRPKPNSENKQLSLKQLSVKLDERRKAIEERIEARKLELAKKHAEAIENLNLKVEKLKQGREERNKKVLEDFRNKSILRKRLVDAFPKMKVNNPKTKKKRNKKD